MRFRRLAHGLHLALMAFSRAASDGIASTRDVLVLIALDVLDDLVASHRCDLRLRLVHLSFAEIDELHGLLRLAVRCHQGRRRPLILPSGEKLLRGVPALLVVRWMPAKVVDLLGLRREGVPDRSLAVGVESCGKSQILAIEVSLDRRRCWRNTASGRELREMNLSLGLLKRIRGGGNWPVAHRGRGANVAVVKELHLRVNQVAGRIEIVVAEVLVVLRVVDGPEHLLEFISALHWPWDYLVVDAAEHLRHPRRREDAAWWWAAGSNSHARHASELE